MTQDRINKARALAEAHGGKSGKIILDLCTELEKVRRLKLRQGLTAVSVLDPWPYHPHLDKTFAEVPEDYLLKWRDERSRDALMHDVCLGIIAARDLRLYDLITKLERKPKDNGQPDIKTETGNETSEPCMKSSPAAEEPKAPLSPP